MEDHDFVIEPLTRVMGMAMCFRPTKGQAVSETFIYCYNAKQVSISLFYIFFCIIIIFV